MNTFEEFVFNSERLPPMDVCKKLNVTVYKSHYTVVQLKCQWRGLLQYMQGKNEEIKARSATKTILDKKTDEKLIAEKKNTLFDIEFENTRHIIIPNVSITEISDSVLSLFRIRNLVASNLGLDSITFNAFSECCENLEVLDLSKNNLRRIDKETLKPLKNLRILNLSNNLIQMSNNNFENNKLLEEIRLAYNSIQYLPERLFAGNERLKYIDLESNGFRTVDACIFSPLKSYGSDAEFVKEARINALSNPIECDCDAFYLATQPKITFDVKCASPSYYLNQNLLELTKSEKPDKVKCSFDAIRERCNPKETKSLVPIIVLSVFLGVFVLLSLLCCCQIANLSGKLRRSRNRSASVPHPPANDYKVLSTVDHKE